MARHNPRTDVVSRAAYPAERLFRIVASGGRPVYDRTGRAPGRGAYVLKDLGSVDSLSARNLRRLGKFEEPDVAALKEELRNALR